MLGDVVVGWIIAPRKKLHALIPGTYKYVTLHRKRDFVEVIKLKILGWEIILNYLGGPDTVTMVL